MLESIAIKLITVLAGYAFEATLNANESVKIEGAPSWYMNPSDDGKNMIWVYAMLYGGPETIDPIKQQLQKQMVQEIDQAFEVIIYDQFRDLTDPTERAFLEAARNDPDLPVFVRKHLVYHKLEHYEATSKSLLQRAERPATSFGGAKLPRAALIEYQRARLTALARDITLHRADQGFDALNTAIRGDKPADADDPFAELPAPGANKAAEKP